MSFILGWGLFNDDVKSDVSEPYQLLLEFQLNVYSWTHKG